MKKHEKNSWLETVLNIFEGNNVLTFCIGLALIMMTTARAGEKIALELHKWKISSGKIIGDGDQKYFHIKGKKQGISSFFYLAYPALNSFSQVKITVKYRTDIENSRLHSGAWIYIGFLDDNKKVIKNDGVVFSFSGDNWKEIEQKLNVPVGATQMTVQIRIQSNSESTDYSSRFLDVKDLEVERI